ncbi:MAG: lipopolysaccharide biosynthesis protein [Acidobacteriota bacterium]|nr:lipopolysaccharide biosynthesis protein [Acidobacteriota bacterium]
MRNWDVAVGSGGTGTCSTSPLNPPRKAAPQAAPQALSLRLNFAWTTAGTIIYSACQWATVSLLAKLGSPELVGQYALGIAVATPVLMLAQLNLRAVVATDVRNENPFRDYLSLRLATSTLALVLIALLVEVGGYRHEVALATLMVGFGLAIDGVSDICYGWQQQRERMERIAFSMIARGILSAAAMGIGVYLTHSLIGGLVGSLLTRLVVLLALDLQLIPGNRDWRFFASLRRQGRVLWLSLPLGVVLMLNSLSMSAPRYWIEHHQGERMLGIFAAIASLMTIGGTLVNALGQSATPRLAQLYSSRDRRGFHVLLAQLLGLVLLIGLAGIAIATVAGGPILSLVYRPEYAGHNDLLIAMMAAGAIGYVGSLLGYAITATRTFRAQVPLFVAVAIATAGACMWLIPAYGLMGGGMAIGLGALVQVCGEILILWRGSRRERA